MAVDGQGRPVRFILTGGQRNDITQAPALLAGFKPKCVLADKGHDSRQLVAQIHSLGAQPVIPPRSCQQPRACDKALYRLRNRIERCFARLKPFRRIVTRFDRKPSHFLAFLYLASIPLWVGGMSIRPSGMAVRGISGPLNSLLFLIFSSGPDFERVQNAAGISLTVAMPCGASFSARQQPLRLIAPLSVWQWVAGHAAMQSVACALCH